MKKRIFFTFSVYFTVLASNAYAECSQYDNSNGSSVCISITSYSWLGSENNDFLNPANWQFGELFNAPVGNNQLPVTFGPIASYVNNVFAGYIVPSTGNAVLSNDYTSSGLLRLTNGVAANLTITNNATYTASYAYIGDVPGNNYLRDNPNAADTAVLNLDNGHFVGDVTVGIGGTGQLNVNGTSSMTGNLTLAYSQGDIGTLNIVQGANWTLNGDLKFGSGTAEVINNGTASISGSILSPGLYGLSTDYSFVNNAGAVMNVGKAGSTTMHSLTNNGHINVADGSILDLQGVFSGQGSVNLFNTGRLLLSGASLAEDSALAINGGTIGFNGFHSLYTLALSGNYAIDNSSGVSRGFAGTITNAGQATLSGTMSGMVSVWHNLNGSSLVLKDSSAYLSGNPYVNSVLGTLINDKGASLQKIGGDYSTVDWKTVNNGEISVADGSTLYLSGGFSGNGSANLNSSGKLIFSNKLDADSSLAINGGDIGFNYLNGPFTLTLSGNFGIDNDGSSSNFLISNH
ncbi:hypothetical protein, partial [Methylomonas koyamae]|uniref:hypothetical protein n=1 Tax=Methylomonas koyamae TaxID=702114 RepID=UPI0012F62DE2